MNEDRGHIPQTSAKIDNVFVPLDGTEWHEQAIAISLLFADWFDASLNLFFSLADLPPLVNRGVWRQRAQLSAANVDPSREGAMEQSDDDPLLQNGALYEYGKMMAHAYLDGILARLGHLDVNTTKDVAAGSPAHILTYKAQTSENSLIVMQARPQVGIQRFVSRKMSENLLTTATVPILMNSGDRQDSNDYGDYSPRALIVPMRDESAMSAAMPYVRSIAGRANADITLVFGTDNGFNLNGRLQHVMDSIHSHVDTMHLNVDVERTELPLDDAIAQVQGKTPDSWVIMGSRMRRGVTKRVMASQVDNVRRKVECPLIAIPVHDILPKRESDIDRWLLDWKAERTAIETDERWNRRTMQRSITGALTKIKRSDNGQASSRDNGAP